MSPDKAVEVLTGRPGTEVKLSVLHEGAEEPEPDHDHACHHRRTERPGRPSQARRSWEFLIDKDRKIGYIRITSFIQNTAEDLKKVLDELKEQGMRGLILDLRDDPGGPPERRRRGRRPVPGPRRDRQHQGPEHAAQDLQREQGQPVRGPADGRAGEPEFGLGLGDRLGGPPGSPPGDGGRSAVLRQGLGPEHLRAGRRQQRAEAHGGQLLSPLGREHPPLQERQDHRQVGRLAGQGLRGEAQPRASTSPGSAAAAIATWPPATGGLPPSRPTLRRRRPRTRRKRRGKPPRTKAAEKPATKKEARESRSRRKRPRGGPAGRSWTSSSTRPWRSSAPRWTPRPRRLETTDAAR